jgi:hypothetical protein
MTCRGPDIPHRGMTGRLRGDAPRNCARRFRGDVATQASPAVGHVRIFNWRGVISYPGDSKLSRPGPFDHQRVRGNCSNAVGEYVEVD